MYLFFATKSRELYSIFWIQFAFQIKHSYYFFQAAFTTQKSPSGMAPVNEGRFLLYVTTLQELVPFLYISVLESGPYIDRLTEEMSAIGDNEGRTLLTQIWVNSLIDLSHTVVLFIICFMDGCMNYCFCRYPVLNPIHVQTSHCYFS